MTTYPPSDRKYGRRSKEKTMEPWFFEGGWASRIREEQEIGGDC